MKYTLSQDHQVRLTETTLKSGVYTLEELQKAHTESSFEWCLKYTNLSEKLTPFVGEVIAEEIKNKKEK